MKKILLILLIVLLALVSCQKQEESKKPIEPSVVVPDNNKSDDKQKPDETVIAPKTSTYRLNKDALVQQYGWVSELQDISSLHYTQFGRMDDANENEVIAEMFIPGIDLSLNVYGRLTDGNITAGAVQLYLIDEFGEGNVSITSHSAPLEWTDANVLFNHLRFAKDGMKVFITDMVKIWEYTIVEVAKQGTADDKHMLLDERSKDDYNGTPILTLMTCLGGLSDNGREFTTATYTQSYDYSMELLNKLISENK